MFVGLDNWGVAVNVAVGGNDVGVGEGVLEGLIVAVLVAVGSGVSAGIAVAVPMISVGVWVAVAVGNGVVLGIDVGKNCLDGVVVAVTRGLERVGEGIDFVGGAWVGFNGGRNNFLPVDKFVLSMQLAFIMV